MNRTFSRTRMILPLEAPAPWLQEVEERRLIAVVVNLRAVCQSLHDTLIRKADPNRRCDVEEKVGVHVPRGLEHPERIHPRLAWRSGVVEARDVARLALAVVSGDEDAAARGQVVLHADDEGLPIDGVEDAVRIERHEPGVHVGRERKTINWQ